MKYDEVRIKADKGYLLPLGDLHVGDKGYGPEAIHLLEGNINWIKENKVPWMGGGDFFNCATITSKTNPFHQQMSLDEQEEELLRLLDPIKELGLGLIKGNHEERLERFCGYELLKSLARQLGMKYYGASVAINCKVGIGDPVSYVGYFHHMSKCNARTVGAIFNGIDKLRLIYQSADFYCGFHTHHLGGQAVVSNSADKKMRKNKKLRQELIACGGYCEWDENYPEDFAMPERKMGSPRIRFNGMKRDIHVSV